jgi:uncharacterized membrane protein YhaH (DUF805 family)
MGQVDFNKLWQNFLETVTGHFMDFTGRVGRAQYWYFILVCVAIFVVAGILDRLVGFGLVAALVGLALLLPMGGLSARRIQDTGTYGQYAWVVWVWIIVSGIYQIMGLLIAISGPFGALAFLAFFFSVGWLISLVSLAATIAIIFFCAQPGDPAANTYGPPPPAWTPGPAATV